MKKIFLIIFCLLLSTRFIVAQSNQSTAIKKFTDDKEKFLTELTQFMSADDKNQAELFMVGFSLFWNSDSINSDQRKMAYDISNQMLKKKLKAFPHFLDFFTSYHTFIRSGKPQAEFDAWNKSLDALVKRATKTPFLEYIETTNNLFTNRTIYKSVTTLWKSSTSDFVFKFDSIGYIEFPQNVDVICVKYNDSSVISQTVGRYYPVTTEWVGEHGTVNWRRAGLSPDSVYATLGKYRLEMKSSDYTADSVTFYNLKLFEKPLMGVFHEKILANVTADKAIYPKFDSYSKRLFIKSLFENIDYDGGFSMSGSRFYAIGTPDQKAKFIFYREGSMFVMAQSTSFIVKKDRISCDDAEVSIYLDKDSIYHPMIELKYLDHKLEQNGNITKELTLLRGDNGIQSSPFYDSYHKVDMFFEALYWKTDEPKVKFSMFKGVKTESEAYFESSDYYDQYRFDRLQGIDNENPLRILKKFAIKYGSREFPIQALSNFMTIQIENVSALIINLAVKGFVTYDFDRKMVTLNERLYHFIDSRDAKADYDIVKFNSMVSKQQFDNNASMNLLNNDITIQGVEQVVLSDSHNVVIYPYEQKVSLRKNRDFDFQGKIVAGLFEFYGKDFNFIYDDFKINLNNVDSFTFKVQGDGVDENGDKELIRVRTMIEGVTGDLLIDKPTNKSGVKRLKHYPIFNSKKDSYAFYDRPSIYGGVYNRENFFYQLEPFSFDSIDNFSTKGIEFNGYFASAGIFPDFDDNLKVMADYSLGFVRKAPPEGYPVYEGKGTYFNDIKLSNEGLHGDGELKYLTSTTGSKDFTFFPDSTNASAYKFEVASQLDKDPEYPDVKGFDVYMHWAPYDDIMQDHKVETPLRFYNNQCVLHGRTDLTPNAMTGTGSVEFPKASIDALLFKFKEHEFDTDTCDFKLKSNEGTTDLALLTLDYKGHVDLKEHKGHFKANSNASKVEFPINQYICFMDEFIWYMEQEKIDMYTANAEKLSGDDKTLVAKDGSEMNLTGSQFVSVHPAQDSLRFFSPKAQYDIQNNIITAFDVKFIMVADAAILPDSGKVVVLKRAEIKTLENSKIIANTATKYHEFYNCKANIFERRKYGASGYYDYVDETEKKQPVFFEKILVDSTYQTYALGRIEKEANFTLSPYFDYYGKVKLIASNQNLNFDGNARIKHACAQIPINWMNFNADINPLEIYIPVSAKPKDDNNSQIFAGIMQGKDSTCVYSSFLCRKAKIGDDTLIVAKGHLYYDKDVKEYHIADMGRIKENKFTGNYLTLNSYCDVYGEGNVNLSNNLGKVKLDAYGVAINKTKANQTSLDLVLSMDFLFADKANKILEETLLADVTAQPANLNSETYYKALVNKVGATQADKLMADLTVNGAFKRVPDELIHNLFLYDLRLKWDQTKDSYVSENQLSIGNVNKTQLNRVYKGFVTVKKKRSGDNINIYIEDGNKNWFFFYYANDIMSVISSNKEFNLIINETKPDDRTLKGEKGQNSYSYQVGTEKKKRDFLRDMGVED